MAYQMDFSAAEQFVQTLCQHYAVYAPKCFAGEGRYCDTPSVRFARITSFAEIDFINKPDASIKEVVLPINHTIGVQIGQTLHPVEEEEQKPLLIFARPCDRHGLARVQKTFAEDAYYAKRTAGMKFALLPCQQWDTCFCVSVGTNQTEEYDMAMLLEGTQVKLEIRDAALAEALPAQACALDGFTMPVVTENIQKVTPPNLEQCNGKTINQLAELPMWQTYAKRCIGCGSCNMACATCTCLQTRRTPVGEDGKVVEVRRVWNGCQVVDSRALERTGKTMAEIVPRRVMQRVLDKFYRPHLSVSKEQLCVGCGRCTDVCPSFISFAHTVNTFSQALDALYTQPDAQ